MLYFLHPFRETTVQKLSKLIEIWQRLQSNWYPHLCTTAKV